MNNKELRNRRYQLMRQSMLLRDLSKNDKISYEKSKAIQEEQDKTYKKWNFLDNFIKAKEKSENVL